MSYESGAPLTLVGLRDSWSIFANGSPRRSDRLECALSRRSLRCPTIQIQRFPFFRILGLVVSEAKLKIGDSLSYTLRMKPLTLLGLLALTACGCANVNGQLPADFPADVPIISGEIYSARRRTTSRSTG